MKRRTEGAEASRQALSALIIRFCMLILTGQSYGQGVRIRQGVPG
jgi:hypothetical protein